MSLGTSEGVVDRVRRSLPSGAKDIGVALVVPGLLLFSLFMIYPIAFLAYLSLTDVRSAGDVLSGDSSLVWFENYLQLVSDPAFWNSLGVTWLYVGVSLVLKLALTIGIATLLTHGRVAGKRYMRALVIVPMGFPPIFAISVWRAMFSPARFGPVNRFLSMYNDIVTGLTGVVNDVVFFVTINAPEFLLVTVPVNWTGSRWAAFSGYVATETWLAYPFMVIITVSALQDVPMELHDAAKVDGAGYLTRFRHVTLPAIRGPLVFASILTAATSFQNFLIPWVFNEGGPGRSNELLLVYGYREALTFDNYALSSAIMIVAIGFIGLFMWLAVRKTNLAEGV
ncbi:binding-protein-dependent transport systems inner membrane component [Haloterrigena turkmenica DSM 5511]|uniref:Binding-protein-dependent transport systems inner membrane component n=1 Tax=Haloterrigena turkmenica (strain ATCC 51198 / DSM 5511 / JCM 9101 / NCIMB 13204 / VKM B-1734 / 4k) TaxID=543526 RepID=D2RWM5_HALTV|nr:sugar ABC transporter permease [Haloterrigena turkmenica]ADB61526.1 binding-protein-dependent transport systems inner membrane component [Haloterrigena turkmenica DSM 5511]